MEENKVEVPALMTPTLMETKIITGVANKTLSLPALEKRALELVKNEDAIKDMAKLLEDLDELEEVAEETFKTTKKPFLDAAANCDAGKKLVFQNITRIRGMVKPDYDRILADIDTRRRAAATKEVLDKSIRKGIDETCTVFAKKIATAGTGKALLEVERLINLEKSPSKAKKYGEFHDQAKKLFDEKLIPVVKNQKKRFQRLSALHGEMEEAVSDSETQEAIILQKTIEEVSEDVRKDQALAEDMLLQQDFFPVIEVEEVLPAFRIKRTDISYELVDQGVALKKRPDLLTISLNNKEVKKVAAMMKEAGDFDGKDFLIVDGIKYIVTRQREAL